MMNCFFVFFPNRPVVWNFMEVPVPKAAGHKLHPIERKKIFTVYGIHSFYLQGRHKAQALTLVNDFRKHTNYIPLRMSRESRD